MTDLEEKLYKALLLARSCLDSYTNSWVFDNIIRRSVGNGPKEGSLMKNTYYLKKENDTWRIYCQFNRWVAECANYQEIRRVLFYLRDNPDKVRPMTDSELKELNF